jgi:hypothetical protein
MVEPDWLSARCKKHRDTIANYHRLGMVNLESVSTVQFNREHVKWLPVTQGIQRIFKVFRGHDAPSIK